MVQHSSLSKYTIDADWSWIKAQESCQNLDLSDFEKARTNAQPEWWNLFVRAVPSLRPLL